MIAVDTNILVRYAVKDDPKQTVVATDFLAEHACFVLKRSYWNWCGLRIEQRLRVISPGRCGKDQTYPGAPKC